MKIVLSVTARDQVNRLPFEVHERIINKLYFFAQQPHPLHFAKSVSQTPYYRFRIGDYRALFYIVSPDTICIMKIERRDKVYN